MSAVHPSITPEREEEIREGIRAWTEAGRSMQRTGMVGHGQCFAVAESFEMELKTGRSHCACHLQPIAERH